MPRLGRNDPRPLTSGYSSWTSHNKWPCCSFAEPLDMEDLSSGLGVTKQDLVQGKGPSRGDPVPSWANSLMGGCPAQHDPGPFSRTLPEMSTSEMRKSAVGVYIIVSTCT